MSLRSTLHIELWTCGVLLFWSVHLSTDYWAVLKMEAMEACCSKERSNCSFNLGQGVILAAKLTTDHLGNCFIPHMNSVLFLKAGQGPPLCLKLFLFSVVIIIIKIVVVSITIIIHPAISTNIHQDSCQKDTVTNRWKSFNLISLKQQRERGL